mgnify:FL=1
MPNTVIEAYAYGKPVVASRVGSLAEIVENGKTGFLFEMKDSKDMADKLLQFVKDDTLSVAFGKNARAVCETKYAPQKHMEEVIGVLKGDSK